jgi:hypothetical protein
MLAAILCVWLGVFGPAFAFDLHRWQTLVGALITGAGVLVAAWNVTRQMRLTARSQEYARIERDLPGMQSAFYLVDQVARSVRTGDPVKVLAELEAVGIKNAGLDVTKDVEAALPNTPDQMRRNIIEQIAWLRLRANRKILGANRAKEKIGQDRRDTAGASELEKSEGQIEAARNQAMIADHEFKEVSDKFLKLPSEIEEEIRRQRKKFEALRADQEKNLGLDL